MICKAINFYAIEGKEDELKELLTSLVAPSRIEQGCMRYELFIYPNNKALFTIVEAWSDKVYLDAHMQTAHYYHYKANSQSLVAKKDGNDIQII